MAELQIFVQTHNVKINKTLVDDIKLKVVMETLRNEMEARFDATFARFEMAQNQRLSNLVTTEEVSNMLVAKVQKRVFEVTVSQLEQSFTALEARVINSLPAMQYEIKNGLSNKVDTENMNVLLKSKASLDLVTTLVDRVNKLQEQVMGGGRRGGSDGSDMSDEDKGSRIDEDENESSDDESVKKTPKHKQSHSKT